MKTNETTTANRIYYTTESGGIWEAHFQPLNPKTGRPWQASRGITLTRDCYQLSNWKTGTSTEIIIGNFPAFEVWVKVGGGMTGAYRGYSTEALALVAIAAEKEKSGK